MSYMTVPEGLDPLKHRAEMTAKYGARTLDMMRTTWCCSSCGAPVEPPPAMVLPLALYRSAIQAGESVAQAASGAIAEGGGHDPCPRCQAPSRLVMADLHFFSSTIGRDLVARFTPGAQLQLFTWALADGLGPAQPSPQLDAGVARDALVRMMMWAREEDDAERGCALIAEGIRAIPGDPELLVLLPWLARMGNLELGAAVAEAHVARSPADPEGHYWRAQMIVEAVAANRAPQASIEGAVASLQQALSLRPDYPNAQIAIANVARIRKRDPEAEAALRALLARHPEHPEANYTLGLILLPRAPAEALACFERGEKAAPKDADYPRSRARALLALGRHEEAKGAIARARELSPGDPRIEQVASEISSNSPLAKKTTFAIRAIVAVVLLGTLAVIGVIAIRVMATVKAATQLPAIPSASAVASAAPPAPPTPTHEAREAHEPGAKKPGAAPSAHAAQGGKVK